MRRCATALALAVLLTGTPPLAAQQATRVLRAGDAILFQGRINGRAAETFLGLLADGIQRLVITSEGGAVGPALDIATAVHQRGLDVEVPSTCFSSCANYIFPAGRRKIAARHGVVAWHGNMAHVLYLDRSGQGRWHSEEMVSARQLAAREAEFYRRIGVDGFVAWFGKIAPYEIAEFYWLSVQDMARFGITGVEVIDAQVPADTGEVRRLVVEPAVLERQRLEIQ